MSSIFAQQCFMFDDAHFNSSFLLTKLHIQSSPRVFSLKHLDFIPKNVYHYYINIYLIVRYLLFSEENQTFEWQRLILKSVIFKTHLTVGSINQSSNDFNVFSESCMLQIKTYLCYLANLSPLFLIEFFQ